MPGTVIGLLDFGLANLGFSVRMGLNSGEVVVGKIGDDLRMDYTAHRRTAPLLSQRPSVRAGLAQRWRRNGTCTNQNEFATSGIAL